MTDLATYKPIKILTVWNGKVARWRGVASVRARTINPKKHSHKPGGGRLVFRGEDYAGDKGRLNILYFWLPCWSGKFFLHLTMKKLNQVLQQNVWDHWKKVEVL